MRVLPTESAAGGGGLSASAVRPRRSSGSRSPTARHADPASHDGTGRPLATITKARSSCPPACRAPSRPSARGCAGRVAAPRRRPPAAQAACPPQAAGQAFAAWKDKSFYARPGRRASSGARRLDAAAGALGRRDDNGPSARRLPGSLQLVRRRVRHLAGPLRRQGLSRRPDVRPQLAGRGRGRGAPRRRRRRLARRPSARRKVDPGDRVGADRRVLALPGHTPNKYGGLRRACASPRCWARGRRSTTCSSTRASAR